MQSYTPEARPSANGAPPTPTTAPDGTALGAPVDGVTAAGKRKKKKVRTMAARPGSLLARMNANVATLRRVRAVHVRVAALAGDADADADGAEPIERESARERGPWTLPAAGNGARGIEIGEQAAAQCLRWVNERMLEHVGFQGASRMALDVLAGIMGEYLSNVGRTMRFYLDKYSGAMTAEEIILHTLLEGGIASPADLERHIHDDVLRHGTRLAELEKKVLNAFADLASGAGAGALDDDALFADGDDDDGFAFSALADDLGEDVLGLRAAGIAQELGLGSLAVPRRLLRGRARDGPKEERSEEPPLPYPLPPPFAPLEADEIEEQIGILRPYYRQRLAEMLPLSSSS
ncbi:hypothetical protein K488DRAFT_92843, partial [Vararia minispora EC-137]